MKIKSLRMFVVNLFRENYKQKNSNGIEQRRLLYYKISLKKPCKCRLHLEV